MTNTNLVTFTPNVKQLISKPLHFGNLNVKHTGKRIGIEVYRLRVNLMQCEFIVCNIYTVQL